MDHVEGYPMIDPHVRYLDHNGRESNGCWVGNAAVQFLARLGTTHLEVMVVIKTVAHVLKTIFAGRANYHLLEGVISGLVNT
jgi:hypothetical protein